MVRRVPRPSALPPHPSSRLRRWLTSSAATATLAAALGTAQAAGAAAAEAATTPSLLTSPASVVNPFLGTGDGGAGGSVNSFPGPDVPFGMMQWGPDTSPDRQAGGGYYYNDSAISGFSLTHLNGPGCGAFGDVPILPTVGALPADMSGATAPFSHTGEAASADYYAVTTGSGATAVKTELTEAARSAIGRFTFPAGTQSNLLVKLTGSQNGTNGTAVQVVGTNEVQGSVTTGYFCGASDQYTLNFDIVFDQPFTAHGTWTNSTSAAALKAAAKAKASTPTHVAPAKVLPPTLHSPQTKHDATKPAASTKSATAAAATGPDGLYLTFDTTADQVVQAKVGISYVSTANAQANLQGDQPGWSFDAVHGTGMTAWNNELSKIQIGGGTAARQQIFYTELYHTLLHPNIFSDANGQYVGFDNQVHTVQAGHIQVANFSGWDVYRSQAQLEAIIDPVMASNAAQSMVNDASQNNGMLPKWALNNGETYVMVGDPADGELAGYYAFGARDFDTKSALSYALAEANKPNNIRPDLAYYQSLGYVPSDGADTCCNFYGPVATTMEYGVADASLAQFAAALGDTADAKALLTRSQNWQNLFNPATGYMTPRTVSGGYVPITPLTEDNYVEGDASQYRWEIGWNPQGLVNAMGGPAATAKQLDAFFTELNDGSSSPYAFMGNEFDLAVPWLYDYTGTPWKAQALVNRIRTQLFTDSPNGYEGGNDDLGEISSMGAFSMLGFFPEYTGSADLAMNSPEFPREIIHLANGKSITVNAPGADSVSNYYIQNAKLDGVPWHSPYLPAAAFAYGSELDLQMGSAPNPSYGNAPQDAPPSLTTGEQPAIGYLSQQRIRVSPGGSTTVTLSAQDVTGRPQSAQVAVAPPSGLTASPASGSLRIPPDSHASVTLTIQAASTTPQTFYSVPITLSENGRTLAPITLTVLVAPPGSLLAAFDNAGVADDAHVNAANFDGVGNSYSEQALAAAGLTAGQPVSAGGITYSWPLPAPGSPDNAIAAGQKVTVAAAAGTQQLGLLGSADGGPSRGVMTLGYADGSSASYWLDYSDWTLGGGKGTASFGNGIVAKLPYRDCSGCTNGQDTTATYVFSAVFPVDPAKTLTSVTLPAGADQGRLHVFALGTATAAPTGPVAASVSPASAAAGEQVTVHGSGFGTSQGAGYVAFSDQGTNWGAPGTAAAFTVDSWSDTAITFTVPTPSGTNGVWHVYPGTPASVSVVDAAGQVSDSALLQITPTANPADYYDNAGTSPDDNQACANYDGDGYSYSANTLAAAGITPGAAVTSGGVSFTWPAAQPCSADNILAAGQTMLVTGKAGATTLGLLGSSTNGGASGTLTVAYTDGTSTSQTITLNDWASGPGNGDTAVATMPYRNSVSGGSQAITMYVFETNVALDSSKTVASITLPSVASQVGNGTTAMHVIAVGEG